MGKRRSYPAAAAADSDEEADSTLALDEIEDKISVLRKGRPPPPYTLEDFRDKFLLSAEGINPHRSRDTVDILQSDLVAVFGPQRGKSGFFFGDCKNADVKSEINRIYSIVYQHEHGPKNKLIGKDFAIGIVADVVKKLDVSWAAFAAQSNNNQRSAWKKKMTTALQAKARLTQKSFEEVAAEEGLDDMLQVRLHALSHFLHFWISFIILGFTYACEDCCRVSQWSRMRWATLQQWQLAEGLENRVASSARREERSRSCWLSSV